MAFALSIEWGEHKTLQIRDIHEKFREKVTQYVTQHLCDHSLFKVLGFPQEPNIHQELQTFVKHLLENDCSIVVLDPETEDVHAVALVKWMSEEWRSWTALRLLINSPRMLELIEMVRSSLEDFAQQQGEKWDSLHLFYYHAEENLVEDPCFMWRFFNAICEVARHMNMPRVTYMALSQRDRQLIEAEEFQEIARVIYSMYIHKGRRPFDHLRDIDELYGSLYEKKVEPIRPFRELGVRHAIDGYLKDNKRMTKVDANKSNIKLQVGQEED